MKTDKPIVKFPLSKHKRGWCKKINGKVIVIAGHVTPEKALETYYQKLPALLARTSRTEPVGTQPEEPISTQPKKASITIRELKDLYYKEKQRRIESGQFKPRSWMSTKDAIDRFVNTVHGPIQSLTPQVFSDYRIGLVRKFSVFALDRHVTQVRAMFNWGYRNGYSPLPIWGDHFEKVSIDEKRATATNHKRKHGPKLFTLEQVRPMIQKASPTMRAMILLGINCGLGNLEASSLVQSDIDLAKGVLDCPRHKTGTWRRAILWPETIIAIREAMKIRSCAAKKEYEDLIFLTRDGYPFVRLHEKEGSYRRIDHLTNYFARLLQTCGIERSKGINFYTLRRTYRTVADEANDLHAVMLTMGHALQGMNQTYVQEIRDHRLQNVAGCVRKWLYGTGLDHETLMVSSL